MCVLDQSINLCESSYGQISWCKCCKTFSLMYNSCCSSFVEADLKQFKKALRALQEEDYKVQMMNRKHVILKNAKSSIGFCLTPEDVSSLDLMIHKALSLHEAYEIIYN